MKKIIVIIFISLICCKANDKPEIYNYEEFEILLNKDEGKTYVINFWATWCKPCVEELPHFEQLNKNYKDSGVEVILVSLDMPKMIETHLIPFIKNRKLQSEVIVLNDLRQNMWIPSISEDWSGAIPATLIYNKGKRAFFEQTFTYKTLENQVLKFLN